jgi:hypothetical protein
MVPIHRSRFLKIIIAQFKQFPALWKPRVHCCVHKSPPPAPIQNPVHTLPTSLRSVLLSLHHLRLGLPSELFSSHFSAKTVYALVIFPMCTARPVYLIFLVSIVVIIFGEKYKLWRCSVSFRSLYVV